MRVLKNLLLVTFAICSLAAFGTACLWQFRPDLVQWFDVKWSNRHKKTVNKEASRLAALAKEDPTSAVGPLLDLAKQLRQYEKADHRYHTRKKVLRTLTEALLKTGDYETGLERAEELIDLDNRDIATRLWFGKLMIQHQETRDRGVGELERMFHELPEYGMIARSYFQALLSLGRESDAVLVVTKHLELTANPSMSIEGVAGVWDWWWSFGKPFSPKMRKQIRLVPAGTGFELPFSTPEGATSVRFDAPTGSVLSFSNPEIWIDLPEGKVSLEIPWSSVETHQMSISKSTLATMGEVDPWFMFPLPPEWVGKALLGNLKVELGGYPHWIQEGLLLPGTAEHLALQANQVSSKIVARFKGARLEALASQDIGFQCNETKLESVPCGIVLEDHVQIDTNVECSGGQGSVLTISLPPVVGTTILLDSIEIGSAGEYRTVDLESVSARGCAVLGVGMWVVDSMNPELMVGLGGEPETKTTVRIMGAVR